ncbi:MAG: tRNA 2-thiouridine(34) synthase MnmA [Planctomycetales bacterium 4572_13]|nr:MAG: tRNA 2-thiouridine(34) synthase MnmA [Planctomycetales bacterium 4572_13]
MNDYKLELVSSNTALWQPKKDASRQIVVMMSGGVDSSVTAHLLREQGWDVVGVTMRIPVACRTDKRGCCGADAAFVCGQMNLPHYFVDITAPFNELIIDRFRAEYRRGRTPNPCADCNTFLKFMLIWDRVEKEFGIKYLATGHYAEIVHTDNGTRLRRGRNHAKDQSYFLYGLPARRLPHFVLPLAKLTKDEVRDIARSINIGVAEKPESMELCFAGEGDYRDALIDGDKPGDLLDINGAVIGTHKGVAHYTLGQRRGLGYAAGDPVYVARIDAEANTVTLGTREEISYRSIRAGEVNILIPQQLQEGQKLSGKLRSCGPTHSCKVIEAAENSFTICFDKPQFAPCPGQKLVVYNDTEDVVGGGTIESFQR